jgi:hypothetical protein
MEARRRPLRWAPKLPVAKIDHLLSYRFPVPE